VTDRRLYTKDNSGAVVELGAGTAILYRDNFTGTGAQTAFTLPRAPLNEELVDVYINGLYQNKDTWAISGTTLTFSEAPVAPDSGTGNIEVMTFQSAPIGETDANLVSYTPAGTGAVATNVQAKLRESVSVFDFIPGSLHAGITNGTSTDDLASYLQNALNTGCLVKLPDRGVLHIASQLLVPSGGGILGVGYNATIKAKNNFGNIALIRNFTDNPQTFGARDVNITLTGFKIDGNKANNTLATEFSHGVQLLAVDGATLDVWTVDCKGDGVYIGYSRDQEEVGPTQLGIGCSNINGYIRTDTCARQGVAITCCDNFNLKIVAYRADLFGFDIEPDNVLSYARNGIVYVDAEECGQAASGSRGGVLVFGTNVTNTGKADISNVLIFANVLNCTGDGLAWKDVTNVSFTGVVANQTGNGVVGLDNNFAPSTVQLNVAVKSPSATGITARGTADVINGNVFIASAGTTGASIQNASGGTLQVQINSAAEQGLSLNNTNNMTFPDTVITNAVASGVRIAGSSNGNRFPNLKSISTGAFGWGVQEVNTSNNNQVTNAQLAGVQGKATLVGATSLVTMEPFVGKATYDAPSINAGASTSSTVTVTGAAVGNEVTVTFSVSLAGLLLTSYVSSANTVTFVLYNPTGGAIDLGSATVRAVVTPVVIA
jgi:hypothetical protein